VKISDFGVSHFSQRLATTISGNNKNNDNSSLSMQDNIDLAKTAGSPAFFAPELCYAGNFFLYTYIHTYIYIYMYV